MAGIISNGTFTLGANIGEVTCAEGVTGTGTPDSPVRLDETVLYEFPLVDNTTQPGTFAVSESIQNFEYIRMHVFHGQSSGTWYTTGWAWAFAFPQGAKRFDLVIPAADGTGNLILDRQYFRCSDGVTFSRGNKQRHNLLSSSVSASTLATDFIITKIVGVNRKGESN